MQGTITIVQARRRLDLQIVGLHCQPASRHYIEFLSLLLRLPLRWLNWLAGTAVKVSAIADTTESQDCCYAAVGFFMVAHHQSLAVLQGRKAEALCELAQGGRPS